MSETSGGKFCLNPEITCELKEKMNDFQSFSDANTSTDSALKVTTPPPGSSPMEWDNQSLEGDSPEKTAEESSPDKDIPTLLAEKAGVVAQKASRIAGQISEKLVESRNRMVSASRRSPQGAALTMLGVGIGTGIGCGILLSRLFSRKRRKNRAGSPLEG